MDDGDLAKKLEDIGNNLFFTLKSFGLENECCFDIISLFIEQWLEIDVEFKK